MYNYEDDNEFVIPDTIKKEENKQVFCGAARLKSAEMCMEIGGVKYSDLHYNPKTEDPWAHVRAREGITLWILPKKRS